MIKCAKLSLIIIILFQLYGCSHREQLIEQEKQVNKPSWLKDGNHSNYPAAKYIIGVGLSSGPGDQVAQRQKADQNAFAEIIRQIFAHVSSEVSIEQKEIIDDKIQTVISTTIADTKVRSSLSVSGLRIVDRYFDAEQSISYSFGVLDRDVAIAPHKAAVVKYRNEFVDQVNQSEVNLQQNNLGQALMNLREALYSAYRYNEVLPLFRLLSMSDYHEIELNSQSKTARVEPSHVYVLNKLEEILARFKFTIADGNRQEFILGKPLTKSLIVHLALDNENGLPIENIPVQFHFESGNGKISSIMRTDKNGAASTLVEQIERTTAKVYSLIAELDLEEFKDTSSYAAEWNKRLGKGSRKVVFYFERKKMSKPMKVLILVEQSRQYVNHAILAEEALSQELSDAGLSPITSKDIGASNAKYIRDAIQRAQFGSLKEKFQGKFDIVIIGEIGAKPLSNIEGMIIFRAIGSVKAFQVSKGINVGAESFEDVRGFGNTDEQASENAIRNASIKAAENIVAEILSKM